MQTYDLIVIGGAGGVGSAALDHAARRGVKVLGLDRFAPGHGRGSSHGDTRVIRQSYFEHPDYVPLVLRAYELWRDLEQRNGRRLYCEVGLLQAGDREGDVISGVLESARQHQLPLEELSPEEVARRFPGFRVPDGMVGLYEERAGYLRVEDCVRAHADEAVRGGARLHLGEAVQSWRVEGDGVVVRSDAEEYRAARLVVAAGAWAGQLLRGLGVPLEVRRKPLYWFATAEDAYLTRDGSPCFFFETPQGFFYGFPQIDEYGVKVARHSGGERVADPLALSRDVDENDARLVEAFCAESLPRLERRRTRHDVCMYTMTPDEHFLVDRHPDHPQVAFAAGLSGHGFKFTCVLGEALADLALEGRTDLPVGFLGVGEGRLKS